MNLSTRLDYLRLRLRQTASPALRLPPKLGKTTPPLWTGRFIEFAGLEFHTRNGPSKAKRPARHRSAPIRLNAAFGALQHDWVDRTDLQFALAGHVCATRTLNAAHVQHPAKSERLHPTGNAPPSHHSSVRVNLTRLGLAIRLLVFAHVQQTGPRRERTDEIAKVEHLQVPVFPGLARIDRMLMSEAGHGLISPCS